MKKHTYWIIGLFIVAMSFSLTTMAGNRTATLDSCHKLSKTTTGTLVIGPKVDAILLDRSEPGSVRDDDDDGEGDGNGEEPACEDNPETDCNECCNVLYNPGDGGGMICCDSDACGYAGDDACPSGGTPPANMDQSPF